VAEEQHVAELDDRFAVVLRQLVGVELRERPRQPTLDARGKRLLLFLPVEGDELAEFIGRKSGAWRSCILLRASRARAATTSGWFSAARAAMRFAMSLPFS
jgi:hypothetical protein